MSMMNALLFGLMLEAFSPKKTVNKPNKPEEEGLPPVVNGAVDEPDDEPDAVEWDSGNQLPLER